MLYILLFTTLISIALAVIFMYQLAVSEARNNRLRDENNNLREKGNEYWRENQRLAEWKPVINAEDKAREILWTAENNAKEILRVAKENANKETEKIVFAARTTALQITREAAQEKNNILEEAAKVPPVLPRQDDAVIASLKSEIESLKQTRPPLRKEEVAKAFGEELRKRDVRQAGYRLFGMAVGCLVPIIVFFMMLSSCVNAVQKGLSSFPSP